MNIEEYAKKNHYRTRNLHDGRPVPPFAMDKKKRTREESAQEALRLGEDKCIAIVGERGYVFEQDGRLEWFVDTEGRPTAVLRSITDASKQCTLEQEGDFEAAGTAPIAAIETVLVAIQVRRVGVGNPNVKPRSAEELARARAARKST